MPVGGDHASYTYPERVDATVAAAVGGLLGIAVGAGGVATMKSAANTRKQPVNTPDESQLAPGLIEVLDALNAPSVVVGPDDVVVRASGAAHVMGLVRSDRVVPQTLAEAVRKVRRDLRPRDREIVRDPAVRDEKGLRTVEAHIAPLSRGFVLLLAVDVTEARRLDTVRRDFVANVSHELKTPTGALSLLAEAVTEAADDPESIRRFAQRMNHEAMRLSGLIKELLDLTRVQDSGPLAEPDEVSMDAVIADAVDTTRMAADTRRIQVSVGGIDGLTAYGDRGQLVTALSNLVANAIAYSPEGTRVAIATRADDDLVEISVTDQGIGIPEADLDRVFERFYRVDPARSRATGGTGLGLSIVKHVVANHGGEISVWSVMGEGSTFTMKLPRTADAADLATAAPPIRHDASPEPTADGASATHPTSPSRAPAGRTAL